MPQELSEVVLILVGSTFVILLLISLIIVALFISQKRKFRYRHELANLKHSYDQEVLRTQLETQTQTFETISQELHDNVGTLVSMAMVHLNSTESTAAQRTHWEETNKLLDEAMNILRDISRSINPDNIRKRGLEQSIGNELNRLRRTKLFKIDYFTEGEEFYIVPEKQIIFFRIVQESLNNVIKHSGADHITISIKFNEPHIAMTIRDNGKGFDPETSDVMNKSGLGNMRKRAKLINASLDIRSKDSEGTTIELVYTGKVRYPMNLVF